MPYESTPAPIVALHEELVDLLSEAFEIHTLLTGKRNHIDGRRFNCQEGDEAERERWFRLLFSHLRKIRKASAAAAGAIVNATPHLFTFGGDDGLAKFKGEVESLSPFAQIPDADLSDRHHPDPDAVAVVVGEFEKGFLGTWTPVCVSVFTKVRFLRATWPDLLRPADRPFWGSTWEGHCRYLREVDEWALKILYCPQVTDIPKGEKGYPGIQSDPPEFLEELESCRLRYKDAAVTPRFLKCSLDHYLKDLEWQIGREKTHEWARRQDKKEGKPPSPYPVYLPNELKNFAERVRLYFVDALPLDLEDAPDPPGTDAMGPKPAQMILFKLRNACLRKMAGEQPALPGPVGYGAMPIITQRTPAALPAAEPAMADERTMRIPFPVTPSSSLAETESATARTSDEIRNLAAFNAYRTAARACDDGSFTGDDTEKDRAASWHWLRKHPDFKVGGKVVKLPGKSSSWIKYVRDGHKLATSLAREGSEEGSDAAPGNGRSIVRPDEI